MAGEMQAMMADAQLKGLRRILSPVAWLRAVQSAARVVVAAAQSETRRRDERCSVSRWRGQA